MNLNVKSVFYCCRAAIPALKASGGGRIVNTSSVAGRSQSQLGGPQYAAAKAAVIGFTRQVAAEYATEKIRSNAIAPGWHGGTALGAERRAASTAEDMRIFEEAIHARIAMKHRGCLVKAIPEVHRFRVVDRHAQFISPLFDLAHEPVALNRDVATGCRPVG